MEKTTLYLRDAILKMFLKYMAAILDFAICDISFDLNIFYQSATTEVINNK